MADVKFETTQVLLRSDAGLQTIEIAGFGTPKAAIFSWTIPQVLDAEDASACLSYGFTDGVRQNCIGLLGRGGQGTSTEMTSYRSDRIAVRAISTSSPTSGESFGAAFSQWTENGVEINITTGRTVDSYLSVTLIGGDDVAEVYTNFTPSLGTSVTTTNITDPNFQPDYILFANGYSTGASTTSRAHGELTTGISARLPSIVNYCAGVRAQNSKATADVENTWSTGRCITAIAKFAASVTAYTSTGFDIITNASAQNCVATYLAIRVTNDPDVAVGISTFPTGGDATLAGLSFQPSYGLITAVEGAVNTRTSTSLATSMFNASNAYTNSSANRDNVGTTVEACLASSHLNIESKDADLTSSIQESGHVFNADGWTFTLTDNPPLETNYWYLAVGTDSATGPEFIGPNILDSEVEGTVGVAFPDPTPDPSTESRFTGATSYALQSGTLPAGITVDPTTGNLVGTPDAGSDAGSPYTGIIIEGSD